MITPHEVIIFSVEEVLMDIYDGNPGVVDTETATKAFFEWLIKHEAYYYSNSKLKPEEIVHRAVLEAIKKGKEIVVVSNLSNLDNN